jgi:hypothetical protein
MMKMYGKEQVPVKINEINGYVRGFDLVDDGGQFSPVFGGCDIAISFLAQGQVYPCPKGSLAKLIIYEMKDKD